MGKQAFDVLPCPNCGSDEIENEWCRGEGDTFYVFICRCDACDTCGPAVGAGGEIGVKARIAWNIAALRASVTVPGSPDV